MGKSLLTFFRRISTPQWLLILLVAGISVFNIVLWAEPYIKQVRRDYKIESIFANYWKTEGAESFRAVGLKPTKKLYLEELENYRTQYLEKNPPLIPEKRIAKMNADFKHWWETGGNLSYVNQGIVPDNALYQRELKKWVGAYTQKLLQYQIPFVPAEENFANLFIYWLLLPGILSLISCILIFSFTSYHLERRWGALKILGLFIAANAIGGFLVNALVSTSFFNGYQNEFLKGMSLGLATLLGATARGHSKDEVAKKTTIVAGLLLMVDMIINWFFNPGLFGAVTILSLPFFGVGLLLGIYMPYRKQTLEEQKEELLEEKRRNKVDPYLQKKNKTRENLSDGLAAARRGEYEAAVQFLTDGMQALLQEYPIDAVFLKSTATDMVSPSLFMEISSTQWLEWGVAANSKNIPEVALLFLEKSLSLEENPSMARKALFHIGEIRVRCNLDPAEGKIRLQKVLELGDKDIIAVQTQKILDRNFLDET